MIGAALIELLTDDSGVSALVEERVYMNAVPRNGNVPAIVLQQISAPRDYTNDGQSPLVSARYQFTCLAKTYAAVAAIAEAVRLAISSYEGTVAETFISRIFIEDEGDIPSIDSENEQQTDFGIRVDAEVWFKETV